jgi:hypothetical protein
MSKKRVQKYYAIEGLIAGNDSLVKHLPYVLFSTFLSQ